jgi:hypothetical protein
VLSSFLPPPRVNHFLARQSRSHVDEGIAAPNKSSEKRILLDGKEAIKGRTKKLFGEVTARRC